MSGDLFAEIKDGLNQQERFIASLSPDYIKIDDRTVAELLKFLSGLSAQFNYYNFNDQIDGDWGDLLQSNIHTLITLMSRLDVKEFSKKYERLKLIIKNEMNERKIILYFNDLFEMVWEAFIFLVQLLEKAHNSGSQDIITKDLSSILQSCLPDINKLKYCNSQAQQLFNHSIRINFNIANHLLEGQPDLEGLDIFGESIGAKGKILHAIAFIDEILSGLKSKINRLLSTCEYYLENNNLIDQQFEPHLGLLIAFLHLYVRLQEQLNGFTKKHLDFYYKDFLGISPKPPHPDSVHVILESIVNAHPILLNTGMELLAKADGIEKPLTYKLQERIVVSKACISALKTMYISNHALFSPGNENAGLSSQKIYSGNYPVIAPSAFIRKDSPVSSWPVLGEDQNELPYNERTMDDAEIGIIIGSSLLYLPEGERLIQLVFKFEEKSFEDFNRFISSFAEESEKSEESVLLEMLSSALIIDYTAKDGWEPVQSPEIRTSAGNSIQVSFLLNFQDKGIDLYNPAIHGLQYKNALPLVRLLLNNEASHNAFGLFRNLLLDQLTLKAEVTGFRNVKLQNNIGTLSTENPFQIFGPQPSVGAFLSIKNSNIFNKFTKDFAIRLEWLDLPRDPGGFESYYAGYGTSINNNSFQVKASALTDGRFMPDPEIQQAFPLFNTSKNLDDIESLEETTVIKGIDPKKIEFLHGMRLAHEEDDDQMFKEGVVKITLSSPSEGFGQKLFPQILPGILLHNSKRFNKPRPIPNQPFIPMVKSISINYTLEHTEIFTGGLADATNVTTETKLIHQYPFGFKAIYPENENRTIRFMPEFEYPNNLYIGIKDFESGNELSLLFKLEEKDFHHTVHKPSPVLWSYLNQNVWTPIKPQDILQDTTNNFVNTGILRIKIPYDINTDNTILNPGFFWLRASTQFKSDIKSRVIAIYANAATAVRVSEYGQDGENNLNLPPNSITGFKRKVQGIQNIWQPFSTFGGEPGELENLYRTRVSERLRHKKRPVTMSDIEQFILDEFPQILMVKCLRASEEEHLVLPGVNIQIILIPKEQDNGQFISEQPKVNLNTLLQVKQFITPFLSPFIKIEVGNPVYEKVKIICKVKFNETESFSRGYYMQALNNDIRKYICSWLYESGNSIKIGSIIYLSDFHNYIKNLHYIDSVTGFSLVHFFKKRDIQTGLYNATIIDSAIDHVDFIQGSTPEAILIPASDHLISMMEEFEYEAPVAVGVGSLSVGNELLVTQRLKAGADLNKQPDKVSSEEYFRLIINNH